MATKKIDGFHVLETEQEFDEFVWALLSSIGTALAMDDNRSKEEVDELMQMTHSNIMFICAEYHGLVNEGKIKPMEGPEGKTKDEVRKDTLEQLKIIKQFFKIAELKEKEEKQDGNTTKDSEN